jgi:hypothetical protein
MKSADFISIKTDWSHTQLLIKHLKPKHLNEYGSSITNGGSYEQ